MNNNKTRGISGLSILLCVLVLAGVYWFMSQSGVQQTAYTYQDFQKDLKKEKVESVEVKQNKVAPTGTLKIRLKNDDIEQLHVSDVNSAEDLLESYDISYSVDNVPQDSWMSTTLVPIILMAGIMVFVVMMMNRQGGSNAKAMNFGKEQGKDEHAGRKPCDVCAGCRTAGRKGRACRDRGFPQEPREVYAGRSQNPERCPS